MSNENGSDLQRYVESKITKITLKAKNFSLEEMDMVDEYCKQFYDNNRKLMILDLIRYKSENLALNILNDKMNLMYDQLYGLIPKEKKDEAPKKTSWKGFSSGEKK